MPRTTKGVDGGKRHPLNMRTTKVLREALEASAVENGRSLAQEVEQRLENSFRQDYAFGSRELTRFAFGVASHFAVVVQNADWTRDPVVYARGAAAVAAALLRDCPGEGEDRARAIESIASAILSRLATEQQERAA